LLEWLRRTLPGLDVQMKKFLFTSGPITGLSDGVAPAPAEGTGLGLGNLK